MILSKLQTILEEKRNVIENETLPQANQIPNRINWGERQGIREVVKPRSIKLSSENSIKL